MNVDNPISLLSKVGELLDQEGSAFISTCCNCPAIDHVYHFHNIHEIRDMLQECGFSIERDILLTVDENIEKAELEEAEIAINYAAIIKAG